MSDPKKKYWEMTTAELREATAEFDKPFVMDTFRELTPEERAEWDRIQAALKKSYASRNGQKPATFRVDPPLAKRLAALAKKRKVSRTRLVNELLCEAMDRLGKK